jgi:hypothetical protein
MHWFHASLENIDLKLIDPRELARQLEPGRGILHLRARFGAPEYLSSYSALGPKKYHV